MGPTSLAALAAAGLAAAVAQPFRIDTAWHPDLPAGSGVFSAVAVSGGRVFVAQRDARYRDPVLVLSREGALLHSFGAGQVEVRNGTFGGHGLSVQPADPAAGRMEDSIWVLDFFNSTVLAFSVDGELRGKAGGDGTASTDVDKFGAIADIAFQGGSAYVSDGDGGINNRVEAWAAASGVPEKVKWVSPAAGNAEFASPHSICWHKPSDLLLVADRDHARIALLDPKDGTVLGNLGCDALGLGAHGKPFGVRTLRWHGQDLLFVAVANNPQDGGNQFVHVVDIHGLRATHGCRAVLQTLPIDPSFCRTPHLMGVDQETGDVYLACVAAPASNLVRIVPDGALVV